MKFRVLEKSVYNNWSDLWETRYFVQSRIPYVFFWDTYGSYESKYNAECAMIYLSQKYLANKGFKRSRKVIKEIEV
jgi:hypothetical protein